MHAADVGIKKGVLTTILQMVLLSNKDLRMQDLKILGEKILV